MGTYVDVDSLGMHRVTPFELSPVRSESQIDRMMR
jgi:hypothetical protein